MRGSKGSARQAGSDVRARQVNAEVGARLQEGEWVLEMCLPKSSRFEEGSNGAPQEKWQWRCATRDVKAMVLPKIGGSGVVPRETLKRGCLPKKCRGGRGPREVTVMLPERGRSHDVPVGNQKKHVRMGPMSDAFVSSDC